MAMITASWKMGKIENETQARMMADLFKSGRYLVVLLLIIEFYKPIKGFGINLLGMAYDVVNGTFDFIVGLL